MHKLLIYPLYLFSSEPLPLLSRGGYLVYCNYSYKTCLAGYDIPICSPYIRFAAYTAINRGNAYVDLYLLVSFLLTPKNVLKA